MAETKTVITITLPGKLTEDQWLTIRSLFKNATRTEVEQVHFPIIERATDKQLPLVEEEKSVIISDVEVTWETAKTRRVLPLLNAVK